MKIRKRERLEAFKLDTLKKEKVFRLCGGAWQTLMCNLLSGNFYIVPNPIFLMCNL